MVGQNRCFHFGNTYSFYYNTYAREDYLLSDRLNRKHSINYRY